MRIYISYCSWQKDDRLKDTGLLVTPDKLYTSPRIKEFIAKCREVNAPWAIFSDYCGIWFPNQVQPWYDFHPDLVTQEEEARLAIAFKETLSAYNEIFYYMDPKTLHPLYKRIVISSGLANRARWFSALYEIT